MANGPLIPEDADEKELREAYAALHAFFSSREPGSDAWTSNFSGSDDDLVWSHEVRIEPEAEPEARALYEELRRRFGDDPDPPHEDFLRPHPSHERGELPAEDPPREPTDPRTLPPMPADLAAALGAAGFDPECAGLAAAAARPSVRIAARRVEQGDLAPTASRFGGSPHLRSPQERPRGPSGTMLHAATLRLSELAAWRVLEGLPTLGFLRFWFDAALMTVESRTSPSAPRTVAVTFDPDERPAGLRLDVGAGELGGPEGVLDREKFEAFDAPFFPCALTFAPATSLPDFEWLERFRPDVHARIESERLRTAYFSARYGLSDGQHRVGGHGYFVQSYVEDTLAALRPGGPPNVDEPDAWTLLLQLDFDPDGPGWGWFDAGTAAFWIHREDLARRDFDRAIFDVQFH